MAGTQRQAKAMITAARRCLATWAALAVLAGLLAVPTWAAGVQPATLTPEDLLAAFPAPSEVPDAFPVPDDWWAGFPQFYVGPANLEPLRGERFYLGQAFSNCNDPARESVEVVAQLFRAPKDAHRAFVDLGGLSALGATVVKGPVLGDESRYFVRSGPIAEATWRYRVGPITGRVSLRSAGAPAGVEAVSKYGEVLVDRLRAVLEGKLAAAALPGDFAQLMPPAAAVKEIGPLLGSAVVPTEARALLEDPAQPLKARDALRAGGVEKLYFRRYAVSAVPGHVIEVTLLPFRDAEAAARWVRVAIKQAQQWRVWFDAGDTGLLRVFTRNPGGTVYELQFTKGRLVGDVVAYELNLEPASSAVIPVVRKMAELWWASLPTE